MHSFFIYSYESQSEFIVAGGVVTTLTDITDKSILVLADNRIYMLRKKG